MVNYEANNKVKVSDHKPVFAQFMLKFNKKDDHNKEIREIKKRNAKNLIINKNKKSALPPKPVKTKIIPIDEREDKTK